MADIVICNRALSTYLRDSTITSLTDGSPAAAQCALHYEPALRALLARHPWHWARRRVALAQLVNDNTAWTYKYAMPPDSLRIVWVNTASEAREALRTGDVIDTEREISGGAIYSDVEGAVASFVAYQDSSADYPALFADALAAELASRIAMPITQTVSVAKNAMDAADVLFDRARVADEMEVTEPKAGVPDYLRDRGVT